MNLNQLLERINISPDTIDFSDCIQLIDLHYHFTPTAFSNGSHHNAADQNNGSCKIFAFGKLHQLTKDQVLACFGSYYREDVLQNPDARDHQNIRQFMRSGWAGIHFEGVVLIAKSRIE